MAASAALGRYVPGWKVARTGTTVTSTCTTRRWQYVSKSPDLATVARVDHELAHRGGRIPPPATDSVDVCLPLAA